MQQTRECRGINYQKFVCKIDVLRDHVVIILSSAAWSVASQAEFIAVVEELTSSRDGLWKTTGSRLKIRWMGDT